MNWRVQYYIYMYRIIYNRLQYEVHDISDGHVQRHLHVKQMKEQYVYEDLPEEIPCLGFCKVWCDTPQPGGGQGVYMYFHLV